jgi:formylglycine-generating enzyme required for sulfatase activity
MKHWIVGLVVVLTLGTAAQASVFDMGGTRNPDGTWNGLASLETVPVGNLRNTGELSGASAGGEGPDAIVGSVSYTYNIGTYEVTAAQYVQFLNTVAATDTYYLYQTGMSAAMYHGCGIERSGTSGSYTYSVAPDRANRPVNYVSWYDAARFCNWLTTGNTESGVYEFTEGALTDILDHETAAGTLGGKVWFLPTEDEWYKAAYHKNDGVTGNYWDYPTGTNAVPSNDLIDPDPGNNANFDNNGFTIGGPYFTTEVGEFENSESPYGTFDQGGNLWEWNETLVTSPNRGLRGGPWAGDSAFLEASRRKAYYPDYEHRDIGFRVASVGAVPAVPEPSTLIVWSLLGTCGLCFGWRSRYALRRAGK